MGRVSARLMVIASAILWGTSFPVIRFGLEFVSAGVFLFLRFLLATLLVYFLGLLTGHKPKARVLLDGVVAYTSILNGVGYALQFLGQEYTYATNAAILINTSPIFTAVFAHYMLDEKLTRLRISAVLLAFAGASIMVISSSGLRFSLGFLGNLLCLLAGLVWGLYVVESKKLTRNDFDDFDLLFSWFFYTSLLGLVIVIFEGDLNFSYLPLFFGVLLYVVLFCTLFAFLLWFKALRSMEASTSSSYFLLEVLISSVIEYVFLGYDISTLGIMGAIMIIAGVYIMDITQSTTEIS